MKTVVSLLLDQEPAVDHTIDLLGQSGHLIPASSTPDWRLRSGYSPHRAGARRAARVDRVESGIHPRVDMRALRRQRVK